MRITVLILFLAIFFMVIFIACKHEPAGIIIPPGGTAGGGNSSGDSSSPAAGQSCSADTVYFQNKVLPLLISNCAKSNCHDAISQQDGIELTSYQMIMATADVDAGRPDNSKLYKVLNERDPDKIMPRPPSNPLTAAEKNIIYQWIAQGAKNNACSDCDTITITYSEAVVPVINTNCKGCHNPSFLSSGLDLTSYASIRIVALDGRLTGSIDHLAGFPPMPMGGAKLSDCKITQIKKWIAAGAQNN